ncbi:MAG: type I DNA topoisomerase [Nitrospiraceae bacterium]|nr:type I DNA topoisomerase [Nitrospiraceae bacterium]
MGFLVIVESPAKARTLGKILGKDFTVKASVGHIKDLPEKELGVDKEHDFKPSYVIIPGKEKIVRELKTASRKAEKVFLAPDPDREGEAIAYHIASEINGKKGGDTLYRVSFHEITERAVRDAMEHPGHLDLHMVDAQQARRVLDRLVGYELSPLLWRKVRRGLSAGRVQSVAVRLVVERERELEGFKQEEYWSIEATFEGALHKGPFAARLHTLGGKPVIERGAQGEDKFLLKNEEDARSAMESARAAGYVLSEIEKKLRRRSPAPPFITSTMQQEAFQRFQFTAKKTMLLAQQLYEGVELEEGSVGLITYMRTDSVNVAQEAQQWARKLIAEKFGKQYLPDKPPRYKNKAGAQEAHEAIRPTYMEKSPETVKPYLSKDQIRLYGLVWNRFLASQMAPALLDQTVFTIDSGGGGSSGAVFKATGSVLKFDGFLALYREEGAAEEGAALLPALEKNEALELLELKPDQHFTQPPPRFTEASLVKALEEKAIGRPSTYAAILSTIQDRKYVAKDAGKFKPTDLGMLVNDLLVEKFPELMDVGFTARMEDELDQIEQGKMQWPDVIKDFYRPFSRDLENALNAPGRVRPEDVMTDMKCEKCGKPMVKRWGRHGWFLACSGYPECRNTRPLEGAEGGPAAEPTGEVCEKCGAPMVLRAGRFGRFLACSRYPECKATRPLPLGVKCPLDGGNIVERRSKKGRLFYSCSNYPNCNFISWYRPVNRACPECGNPYLLEKKTREALIVFCPQKGCRHKEEIKEEAAGE